MLTREQLYELVWSKPMTKVAQEFNVSGSYMARVCAILGVPRPERGYWAKREFGKAPSPLPLSAAEPGDPLYWSKDAGFASGALTRSVSQRTMVSKVLRRIRIRHVLVDGAHTHFESSRPVDDGAYLRPFKRLLVDINASKAGLEKALDFANDLFNALESAGHSVVIAPHHERFRRVYLDPQGQPKSQWENHYNRLWSPDRPTIAYIGNVAIGLAIVEISESVLLRHVGGKYIRDSDYVRPKASRYVDHTWTTTKDLPCGRLRLVAYSPYWRVPWFKQWEETSRANLSRTLPAIVKTIEKSADDMVEKLQEADRQAEVERVARLAQEEEWRKKEDRQSVQESIKASRTQLVQVIQAWSDVVNLERFFEGVQERAKSLPVDERGRVLERLKLAREFAGTQNPLEFFLAWKSPNERYRPLFVQFVDVDGDQDESASEIYR